MENKIPKIIHQIWFGDQSKRPEEIMDKWKTMNPSWEYWLWTEDDIKRVFGKLQNQKHFDDLVNLNKFLGLVHPETKFVDTLYLCGQSDIARYEILYAFGGFFIDSDSDPLRPLNDDFCNNEAFSVYEGEDARPGQIANGFLACTKFNPLMKLFIKELKKIPFILYSDPWKVTGPLYITNIINTHPEFNIKIYPSYYFLPNHFFGNSYKGNDYENIYCEHLWKTAKSDPLYEPNLPIMIPKRIFFYWSGNNLSWMRYMTLFSCRKFNPDWEIVLYLSDNTNKSKTWNTMEEQDFINYDGINYLDKLEELNIKIEKVEWDDDIKNKISGIPPNHESDLFRYYELYRNGGIYCDMDILFFRSIDEFYDEINNKYDTVIYQCEEYIATGLLASSKDNEFYKNIFNYAIENFNVNDYQSMGVHIIYKKYNNGINTGNVLNKIIENYPNLKIYSISTSLIYQYDFQKIKYNFTFPLNINNFDEKSIGYHWYAGHELSQYYNNFLTENNYMYHNTTFTTLVKGININKKIEKKEFINNKFIVVIPVYNAEKYIEKCIDSILDQEYDNFNFVVIDDCSTDNTTKILQNLHKEYIFDLIINDKRNGSPLENIIKGIKHLSTDKEDIIVTVDGDDWLYDNTVLSYLNSVYQDENIWMTYGQYEPLSKTYTNMCKPVPDTKEYRKNGKWLTSHLRTVKRKLWDKINDDDLRDRKGNYFKVSGDAAWMYPIIEMSGHKHMKFIDKVLYVYNDLNPISDQVVNLDQQLLLAAFIRNKKEYEKINNL